VQYEVKFDEDPECGGAYVKLGPKIEDPLKFGDPTPYYIMFGPDKCGYNKRTHLIFNYNGENVLKTSDIDWKQDDNEVSTLYRLTVKADGSVAVKIGKEDVYTGKIEDDWKLLPEKEIDDPDDKKPSDWVDEAMMDDPEDEKPSDWVEVEKIPDPEAKKPDDWDDEEDGDWEIPEIDNPEFKGPWKPKRISNPEYKGVWAAKKIANPKYDASKAGSLHVYEKFAFIGFDLWQVKGGTHFDNMIITDDVNEADTLYEAWVKKSEYETETKKVEWSKTSTTTEAPEPGSVDEDDIEADGDDEDL
jgi:calreticulin